MTAQRYLVMIDTALGGANCVYQPPLARVQGLKAYVESPVLSIFASPGCCYIASGETTPTVLGTLFDRPGGSALRLLPQEPAGGTPLDRATAFTRAYWGAYMAIWHDAAVGRVTVLRDPLGALPCYYIQRGDRAYVASDTAIMVEAGLLAPMIDRQQLTMHLMAIQYRSARTSVANVLELPPGHALTSALGSIKAHEIWSPWMFARPERLICDATEASARVRHMTERVVKSWASTVMHPLLTLSGGLDSSIVAATLHASGATFDCLTLATANPAGDERIEARAMAAFVGAPLHERLFDISMIDVSLSAAAHLPRPTARAFGQETDRLSLEIAGEVGADSFFHGGGGDNVFCYLHSVAPILDSLAVRGIRQSWATMRDVALLTGTDLPTIARATAGRLWTRRRAYHWAVDTRFLAKNAIDDVCLRFDHTWLQPDPTALAGSAAHIANLLAIQNYLEGYRRERVLPVIAPLLSQPLVELCLQIPSWLWVTGGANRAVARNAFVDRLPPATYRRRTKGTPDSVTSELLEANQSLIRDMLLGGVLASHDLLDTPAIETVLHDLRPASGETASRILALCDAEAWARSMERSDVVAV